MTVSNYFIVIGIFINCAVTQSAIHFAEKNVPDLFPVSIIHINDFHARFEETNEKSNTCKTGEKCIGGYARVVSMVKQLQAERAAAKTNPIYLNAGDNFQGTLWYNILRWNITSYFLNLLPADAITLGNHEFDHKIQGVVPFLKTLTSPVLVSNIDDSQEPTIQGLYDKSMIIDRYNRKIGIIGVILQTTNVIAQTEKLRFYNEPETVAAEALKLKEKGVDIIIVLSHCGLDVDFEIAKKGGPYIDVIVGGHSHSFMFTGDTLPGPDKPVANYPEMVTQPDGHKVLIVQASAFTKYVGNLTVWFDENGELQEYEGSPIYLDENVIPDPDIAAKLLPFKDIIDQEALKKVGETFVELDKGACSYGDCNIGNFITDAFVYAYLDKEESPEHWSGGTIALANVGGIRTSLSAGGLTLGDLVTVTPFENTVDLFDLRGDHLWDTIEYSLAKSYSTTEFVGANLVQVSGLKIIANVTKPVGNRVISIDILCRKCKIPEYYPLNRDETYKVITTNFIAGGGDGFDVLKENSKNYVTGGYDIDAVVTYVKRMTPIMPVRDGRFRILT